MIRVLHIISSTWQTNGSTNVIMNYYREIVKYDIQFDFLVFKNLTPNYDEEIAKLGGKVIKCVGKNKIDSIKKIRKKLKEIGNDYDFIENHEVFLTTFFPKLQTKLILHSHTVQYSQTFIASIRNKLLCRNLEKKANYFFSCSRKSAEVFWPKVIGKKNFRYVNNAIKYSKYLFSQQDRKSIRAKYKVSDDITLLGYVARLDYGKNQEYLIEIMKSLPSKYKLILVGSGVREEFLKKLAKEYSVSDCIIFVGLVASGDISKYLSAMDIFLFPSRNEGLGQVAIEAQANGLCCIASTGIPEEAKISNGFIFLELDGVDKWVKTIEKMKTERQSIDFVKTGYDIDTEAYELSKWYQHEKQ